jgi:hypothetical protein
MQEPISPELALVDPDLAARARAALPYPERPPVRWVTTPAAPRVQETTSRAHPYPMWARLTAALWLLVLGILIGGAAVPHAQDRPRVLTPAEQAAEICKPAQTDPTSSPGARGPAQPGP